MDNLTKKEISQDKSDYNMPLDVSVKERVAAIEEKRKPDKTLKQQGNEAKISANQFIKKREKGQPTFPQLSEREVSSLASMHNSLGEQDKISNPYEAGAKQVRERIEFFVERNFPSWLDTVSKALNVAEETAASVVSFANLDGKRTIKKQYDYDNDLSYQDSYLQNYFKGENPLKSSKQEFSIDRVYSIPEEFVETNPIGNQTTKRPNLHAKISQNLLAESLNVQDLTQMDIYNSHASEKIDEINPMSKQAAKSPNLRAEIDQGLSKVIQKIQATRIDSDNEKAAREKEELLKVFNSFKEKPELLMITNQPANSDKEIVQAQARVNPGVKEKPVDQGKVTFMDLKAGLSHRIVETESLKLDIPVDRSRSSSLDGTKSPQSPTTTVESPASSGRNSPISPIVEREIERKTSALEKLRMQKGPDITTEKNVSAITADAGVTRVGMPSTKNSYVPTQSFKGVQPAIETTKPKAASQDPATMPEWKRKRIAEEQARKALVEDHLANKSAAGSIIQESSNVVSQKVSVKNLAAKFQGGRGK